MDQLFTNPAFSTAPRFAQLLSLSFSVLTYQAGIPLAAWCSVVYCLITFWADKLLLLRASARPPNLTQDNASLCLQLLMFALPVHCAMAIAMYSHQCTFPSSPAGFADSATAHVSQLGDASLTFMAGRNTTWMFLALILLFAVWLALEILQFVVGSAAVQAKECMKSLCCGGGKVQVEPEVGQDAEADLSKQGKRNTDVDLADTMDWNQAKEQIQALHPPASYNVERREDWKFVIRSLRQATGGTEELSVVPAQPAAYVQADSK
jgi:hypothetical protein